MNTLPNLIKKIREEAELTQAQFASVVGVSAILIAMVESGQKEVSKNLIKKIAEKLGVHPTSITPFLFVDEGGLTETSHGIEKSFVKLGEKMQEFLIKKRAKKLRQHV
jgi:transcriptional regulator with XRE-family HTH domain